MKPALLGVIMEHFVSVSRCCWPKAPRAPAAEDGEDDEIVAQIKDLLETGCARPSPGWRRHHFPFFEDGVVIAYAGSCSGCPSSTQH